MTTVKFILAITALMIGITGFGQDYFIADGDTTFCKSLHIVLGANEQIKNLTFEDSLGNQIVLKRNMNLPNITTFRQSGTTCDLVPINLKKPNGHHEFVKRVVDGTLRINCNFGLNNSIYSTSNKKIFYIRFPDGNLYEINNENIATKIEPYLKRCPKFNDTIKYKLKKNTIVEAVRVYNEFCL